MTDKRGEGERWAKCGSGSRVDVYSWNINSKRLARGEGWINEERETWVNRRSPADVFEC